MLVRAVLMSSSDLSANALPWDNHYNKVLSLFEEFYKQVIVDIKGLLEMHCIS